MSDRSSSRPVSAQASMMSGNSRGRSSFNVTDTSYDSQPSWGYNTPEATIINPQSATDFPRIGTVVGYKKEVKRPRCRRCKRTGHRDKDCPTSKATATPAHTQAPSVRGLDHGDCVPQLPESTVEDQPVGDLLEFSDEEEFPTPKTLAQYRGEIKKPLPPRARQWADLDLSKIRNNVESAKHFHEPITEPTLMDERIAGLDEPEEMAKATVPVELKQKRKGRKGKAYYNLSPFVNY
jgi:hypothetical protein